MLSEKAGRASKARKLEVKMGKSKIMVVRSNWIELEVQVEINSENT